MEVNKAIILAGGYGTRMYPITKIISKELLPISNIPAIEFAIKECVDAGINNIGILISRKKKDIKKYIKKYRNKEIIFTFIRQGKKRGTGGALYKCKNFTGDSPFYLIFPDEIYINKIPSKKLISYYNLRKQQIIGLKKIKEIDYKKYGLIEYIDSFDKEYIIKNIIEKPLTNPPSNLAICGRFVLDKSIYKKIEKLNKHNEEYYLTEALLNMSQGEKLIGIELDEKSLDIGNPMDYLKTSVCYAFSKSEYITEIKEIIKDKFEIIF